MGIRRKWLQIVILLAVAVVGVVAIGSSWGGKHSIPKAGKSAPDFEAVDLKGQSHRLSELRGKIVVLNFWGTFCPPCRTEMPDLQKQADERADRGVVVLGMNVGENPVTIKGFLDQYQIRFPVYVDEQDAVRKLYGVSEYPTTFFIDREGVIRQIKVGQMDEAFLVQTLNAM